MFTGHDAGSEKRQRARNRASYGGDVASAAGLASGDARLPGKARDRVTCFGQRCDEHGSGGLGFAADAFERPQAGVDFRSGPTGRVGNGYVDCRPRVAGGGLSTE